MPKITKKAMKGKTFIVALVTAVLCFGTASSVSAKTLKVTSLFPAGDWVWKESFGYFENKVEASPGNAVHFVNFTAGQLGKEASDVMKSGVADMGILVPSYESDNLPLSSVAGLPDIYQTSCQGTAKLWAISKTGGALYKAEYKPQGFKVLFAVAMRPYNLMTTKRNVTSLQGLQGLKVRANGDAMTDIASTIGAVPVHVTGPETYDALTRGTIDGAFWPVGATRQEGVDKVLHHVLLGAQFGSASLFFAINQSAWNTLSGHQKKIMETAARQAQAHLCSYADNQFHEQLKWLVKHRGLVVNRLSAEQSRHWKKILEPVKQDWADQMDKSGRPGNRILSAFENAKPDSE